MSLTPWKFDNILSIAYADSGLNLHATRVLLPVNQSAVSINPACKLHTNYVLIRTYYFFFFFITKTRMDDVVAEKNLESLVSKQPNLEIDIHQPKADNANKNQIPITNEAIAETQKQRKKLLIDYCEKHDKNTSLTRSKLYRHMLVDQKHKLIYCYTPKVACTEWLRIMGTLKGLPKEIVHFEKYGQRNQKTIHSRKLFTYLSSFPIDEANKMLRDYKTFFFVREPLERILSAYIDKFTRPYWPNFFYRNVARRIIKRVRPNATIQALSEATDLSFDEFTRYIASVGSSRWDHHWGLYDDICRPCKIKYDFIGHFENIMQEGPYLLKDAGVDHLVPIDFRPSNTSSLLKRYYSQIPKSTILKIVEMCRSNFEMFGYPFPGPLMNLFNS